MENRKNDLHWCNGTLSIRAQTHHDFSTSSLFQRRMFNLTQESKSRSNSAHRWFSREHPFTCCRREAVTYSGPHYVFYCCLHICRFNTHAAAVTVSIYKQRCGNYIEAERLLRSFFLPNWYCLRSMQKCII